MRYYNNTKYEKEQNIKMNENFYNHSKSKGCLEIVPNIVDKDFTIIPVGV